MIEITNLNFAYTNARFQIEIPEFKVNAGEHVALIGPSGIGKTTLLQLMAGILAPLSGTLFTNGHELSSLNDTARRLIRISEMGLVFQEFELLEYLSVQDNILLPFRLSHQLKFTTDICQLCDELATQLGVVNQLMRSPSQLSQGERQRVALCRALINQPAIILADEPTGNLDPANKQQVIDLLLSYSKQHQTTVIVATHDHSLLNNFHRVLDCAQLLKWTTTDLPALSTSSASTNEKCSNDTSATGLSTKGVNSQ